MDHGAIHSLMETVRKLDEISKKVRSGAPVVDDYLRSLSADPVTQWFTGLLREKNAELDAERQRWDRLANALRAWHCATSEADSAESKSEANFQLIQVLREVGVTEG